MWTICHHMLLGSEIKGGESSFCQISPKMAHKKAILEKFQEDSESSDCRSPRHDGKTWYIPATSSSDENQKNPKSEEDPGVESRPSTSTQGGPGISPISNLQPTTS